LKTLVDARLLEEAARLRFRFACEDCAHFSAEDERCTFGYPAAPRRAVLDPGADVKRGGAAFLELCKAFELA
jgi:hypothetical protein